MCGLFTRAGCRYARTVPPLRSGLLPGSYKSTQMSSGTHCTTKSHILFFMFFSASSAPWRLTGGVTDNLLPYRTHIIFILSHLFPGRDQREKLAAVYDTSPTASMSGTKVFPKIKQARVRRHASTLPTATTPTLHESESRVTGSSIHRRIPSQRGWRPRGDLTTPDAVPYHSTSLHRPTVTTSRTSTGSTATRPRLPTRCPGTCSTLARASRGASTHWEAWWWRWRPRTARVVWASPLAVNP